MHDPGVTTGCEHCPPGIPCDPVTGACVKGKLKFRQNISGASIQRIIILLKTSLNVL